MGKVSVENVDGRLRLRFSYNGNQRAFHLGLSSEHKKQAELIAKQLEYDISVGRFNGDLSPYKWVVNQTGVLTNWLRKHGA